MKKIGIISCNTNNLFSASNAFKKLGCLPVLSNDKKELLDCDMLVLPGVGAFNVAMKNLVSQNLDETIFDFIKSGKIFLGICLGFQLLFNESEELINTKGLGLIQGRVIGFDKKKMIVPHVGWNKVIEQNNDENLIDKNKNDFYFVHSFYAKPTSSDNILYLTEYGKLSFCSGVKKNNIFGTQFHPEKSGKNGMLFLEKLIKKI